MRMRIFVSFLALLALAVFGCKSKSKPKLDVVSGRPPVSTALEDIKPTLAVLAQMPASERSAYLQSHHADLGQRVVYFLRQRGKVPAGAELQGVQFFFGSMDQVKAEDGFGDLNIGYLKDQLVARVRVGGQKAPIDVIVQCLNGIFELPGDLVKAGLANLGGQMPIERFTIGKNDNLVRHVGDRTAIILAERHSLALFRGKGKARQRIFPAEAMRLVSETDRIQVAAIVYEGDRFDLVAGTYTPAHKKASAKKASARKTSDRLRR